MNPEKKMREIAKLQKMKNKPKSRLYIPYLILIICLVYITDEIASQICVQMKTEIANGLFASRANPVGTLETLSLVSYVFMGISLFYKTLSDRYGRKPFLFVNTLGMGLGMIVIYLASNPLIYIVGYSIIAFFIPHDMQVVYIMETAPAKHRAKIYSVIKCISTLGVLLIPVMRKYFMTTSAEWRKVFFIPAIVGLVSSFCALLFAKETDSYIDSRLRYLNMSEEELAREKAEKDASNAQGGFFNAFRFSMKHTQLRRLNILMSFFNFGFIITMYYQVMITYGYASHMVSSGLAETLEKATELVSTNEVTEALFLFPIGSALVQLIQGFIADKSGRKPASIVMAVATVISFVGFVAGSYAGISPYITGFLSGACIGSFWAFGDINIMMMSESAPTNLRSSVLSSCYIIAAVGTAIGMGILLLLLNFVGDSVAAPATLAISIPGFIVSIIILLRTHETKGIDLDTVTGAEWD